MQMLFFWFDGRYIVSRHSGNSKLEYYSLLDFNKIHNDYEFTKDLEIDMNLDFNNHYKILHSDEFEEIIISKRRELKISMIFDTI